VLAAGRIWDDAKNISSLSEASKFFTWPVCVAGDTRHPDGSSRTLANVRMLGKLTAEDLADWLSRAAIYCLPARYEPFGLSVLEAALSGCALVLGDIPSLRENWEGAAAFVPPNDSQALGRELAELIANAPRRTALATAARERALGFTPARMANAYRNIYADLPAGRAALVTHKD